MNVLYLHQHFATRTGAGGTRSYEFAQYLLRRGHRVTMVGQRRRGGGVEQTGRQKVDGIDLILLGGYYTNHLGPWRRTWQFLRFTIHASLIRNFEAKPDVVIASSTPLTIGIPGWILARRYRVPFVFEVRDLWPEAPIQLGVLKNPLLKWLMRRLERFLYRSADVVIPLSPGMEQGVLDAGCDPRKVITIPNASDVELFTPEARDRELLARWPDLNDRFVAVHAGSMGAANGLTYIVEAARILKNRAREENEARPEIAFLIAGAGGTEQKLRTLCAEYELNNVVFAGSIPRKELGAIVSSCDAAVVSFADYPVLATNSPNKLFDGLAAGLPCVVNSPGWTRDLVTKADAGSYVSVNDPAELADAMIRLRDDEKLRKQQGKNARRLAEKVFARERLATRFCEVLEHAKVTHGAPLSPPLRTPLLNDELLRGSDLVADESSANSTRKLNQSGSF